MMDMPNTHNEGVEDLGEKSSSCPREIVSELRPAGFWIRICAYSVDNAPLMFLSYLNDISIKSIALLIVLEMIPVIYKPFMESFCGATLGKMVCRIQVVDEDGKRLSLSAAYIRYLSFLSCNVVGVVVTAMMFLTPGYERVSSWGEMMEFPWPLEPLAVVASVILLLDCGVVAFTRSKCAVHDLIAGSYCVYKQAQKHT